MKIYSLTESQNQQFIVDKSNLIKALTDLIGKKDIYELTFTQIEESDFILETILNHLKNLENKNIDLSNIKIILDFYRKYIFNIETQGQVNEVQIDLLTSLLNLIKEVSNFNNNDQAKILASQIYLYLAFIKNEKDFLNKAEILILEISKNEKNNYLEYFNLFLLKFIYLMKNEEFQTLDIENDVLKQCLKLADNFRESNDLESIRSYFLFLTFYFCLVNDDIKKYNTFLKMLSALSKLSNKESFVIYPNEYYYFQKLFKNISDPNNNFYNYLEAIETDNNFKVLYKLLVRFSKLFGFNSNLNENDYLNKREKVFLGLELLKIFSLDVFNKKENLNILVKNLEKVICFTETRFNDEWNCFNQISEYTFLADLYFFLAIVQEEREEIEIAFKNYNKAFEIYNFVRNNSNSPILNSEILINQKLTFLRPIIKNNSDLNRFDLNFSLNLLELYNINNEYDESNNDLYKILKLINELIFELDPETLLELNRKYHITNEQKLLSYIKTSDEFSNSELINLINNSLSLLTKNNLLKILKDLVLETKYEVLKLVAQNYLDLNDSKKTRKVSYNIEKAQQIYDFLDISDESSDFSKSNKISIYNYLMALSDKEANCNNYKLAEKYSNQAIEFLKNFDSFHLDSYKRAMANSLRLLSLSLEYQDSKDTETLLDNLLKTIKIDQDLYSKEVSFENSIALIQDYLLLTNFKINSSITLIYLKLFELLSEMPDDYVSIEYSLLKSLIAFLIGLKFKEQEKNQTAIKFIKKFIKLYIKLKDNYSIDELESTFRIMKANNISIPKTLTEFDFTIDILAEAYFNLGKLNSSVDQKKEIEYYLKSLSVLDSFRKDYPDRNVKFPLNILDRLLTYYHEESNLDNILWITDKIKEYFHAFEKTNSLPNNEYYEFYLKASLLRLKLDLENKNYKKLEELSEDFIGISAPIYFKNTKFSHFPQQLLEIYLILIESYLIRKDSLKAQELIDEYNSNLEQIYKLNNYYLKDKYKNLLDELLNKFNE